MADAQVPWYYRRWIVILLLFVVLGPLALPLLYKSPCFSKKAKVILTVLMVLTMVYLAKATYTIVAAIIRDFNLAIS
ncbi:MAG TPA: hypothetical protein VL688_01515 [Verrucomicrobiae bacterium]|jgi:hypothetical protein|nr:hypothetical protein [Verrucomicrobiae bacterium]